jgi:amino acid transporter
MSTSSSSLPSTGEPVAKNTLRKNALGLPHAIVISVAVMSPAASIFFNTPAQAGVVGAAIPFCFVVGFIVALFVANQYSEFSRELPSSGSAYTFVTEGLGTRWGFLTGWVGMLFIALGVPYSFVFMSAFLQTLLARWFGVNLHWIIFYVAAVGIVFAIAYIGVRTSLSLDIGFIVFELGICLVLAFLILRHVGSSTGLSTLPLTPGAVPNLPSSSLAAGIIFSVLSFVGFETAATLGEETRNPHRSIPRAVYGSMIIIGLFYIIMAYAGTMGYGINNMVGTVKGHLYYAGDLAPFDTISKGYGSAIRVLIDIVGTLGFFSAALAIVNGGARVFYAVSRDGLLPGWLSWTHPQRQTPGAAIALLCAFGLVCGIPLGLALTPLTAFQFLGLTDASLALFIYFVVSIACLRFFRTKRRAQFNLVRHGIVPALGMLITGGILAALIAQPAGGVLDFVPVVVGAWLLIGIVVTLALRIERERTLESVSVSATAGDMTRNPLP